MHDYGFYSRLGIHSEDEAFSYLIKTFRKSIIGWDFFVDWKKIKEAVKQHEVALNLLNTLIGKKGGELDETFIKLCNNYPEVRKALPILIATRISKLKKFPIIDTEGTEIFVNDLFNKKEGEDNLEIKKRLLNFFIESGIREMVKEKEMKNLFDYCLGVEVGMDTNGRKNRTGKAMEIILEKELQKYCKKTGLKYISQANADAIWEAFGRRVVVDKTSRRFDFVVITPSKRLVCIETNFYGSGGSKLKATAGEYKNLHIFLKNDNVDLVWITDGHGWTTAHLPLREAFNEIDSIANLAMIRSGILENILV